MSPILFSEFIFYLIIYLCLKILAQYDHYCTKELVEYYCF